MKKHITSFKSYYPIIMVSLIFTYGCAPKKSDTATSSTMNSSNLLVQPWDARYNGVPAFDKVNIKDFIPAEEIGIALQRNEINAIANNTEAPNFANTIEAIEIDARK